MYKRNLSSIDLLAGDPLHELTKPNKLNSTNLMRERSSSTESLRSARYSQHPFAVPGEKSDQRSPDRTGFLPKMGHSKNNDRFRSSSLSPATMSRSSSRKGSGTSAYTISRNSTGSAIAFPTLKSAQLISPVTTPRPVSENRIPDMVEAYDKIIAYTVRTYVHLSGSIGSDVLEQAQQIRELFITQREFLLASCKNRTPSVIGTGPIQAGKMKEAREFARKNEDSPFSPHLHFISETVGAMGWVVMGNKPCVFIRESYDNGKHHVRAIKKIMSRESSRSSRHSIHADWIKAWQEVILDLEAFVREYHPHGLVWGRP